MMDLEDLKAEISLEDVLIECGAEFETGTGYGWRSEVPFKCPFHYNVNTAAAEMNTMKGVFHCFACGAGGTVIDAALLHLQTSDIKEAAAWLEEEFLS
jgi:CHC2-type zinc finger protein